MSGVLTLQRSQAVPAQLLNPGYRHMYKQIKPDFLSNVQGDSATYMSVIGSIGMAD
jgi:hypothetical protein